MAWLQRKSGVKMIKAHIAYDKYDIDWAKIIEDLQRKDYNLGGGVKCKPKNLQSGKEHQGEHGESVDVTQIVKKEQDGQYLVLWMRMNTDGESKSSQEKRYCGGCGQLGHRWGMGIYFEG